MGVWHQLSNGQSWLLGPFPTSHFFLFAPARKPQQTQGPEGQSRLPLSRHECLPRIISSTVFHEPKQIARKHLGPTRQESALPWRFARKPRAVWTTTALPLRKHVPGARLFLHLGTNRGSGGLVEKEKSLLAAMSPSLPAQACAPGPGLGVGTGVLGRRESEGGEPPMP